MTTNVRLKDLKPGDYFTKKFIQSPSSRQVFVRGEYDRSTRKYLISRFSDFCDSSLLSGDTLVYVDFNF